ncbi:fungal class II heme-containing peroxidase [Teratosphaeriaceae sp. CCFEE 6253]|nr:fungal class II heme-containing peroxidase [Teratosphaeriaceae sp. CCFEE 6253]
MLSLITLASLLLGVASASNSSACPAIWSTVAADLKASFSGCNNQARSAIRFAFHDAAGYSSKTPVYAPASGGADGSLLLSAEEISRPIENPLQIFKPWLLAKYNQYQGQGVGAADLVQFAGNIAIRSCPGGPVVQTLIGREDSSTPAPDGTLPEGFGPGSDYDSLTSLFADKGFSTTDLAALVGAHTCSRAFAQRQIPFGGSQDSTPTQWDTKYYQQLQSAHAKRNVDDTNVGGGGGGTGGAGSRDRGPQGVYHFASDINLSNPNTTVGQEMARFATSLDAFNSAFVDAMGRMNLLGIPASVASGFVDCTHLVE